MRSESTAPAISLSTKESLMLAVFILSSIWHIAVGLSGFVIYVFLYKGIGLKFWWFVIFGLIIILIGAFLNYSPPNNFFSINNYFHNGIRLHIAFWKHIIKYGWQYSFSYLYKTQFDYLIGLSFISGFFTSLIDFLLANPHEEAFKELQNKKTMVVSKLSDKKINKLLLNLKDENFNGTSLGVSKYTGRYVIVPDKATNEVVLVLGTTGGGKTITLRRFFRRAILKDYPLIIVDGKPSNKNVEWVLNLAKEYNRPFFGFNCASNSHYNPLSTGGFTELKDKIICLKDEWESDYYKSIAEDYLQTALQVLIRLGKKFDLQSVADCLDLDQLSLVAHEINDPKISKRVRDLESYNIKDITGLKAHLNILINSELGEFFSVDRDAFSLSDVIQQNGVAYFALPALRFPSFSKVLGKLIINDLKAVIDKDNEGKQIFAIFDEFSVFASDQSLNLVNMGREKGLHSVFGTQGLAELSKVDDSLKKQFINCVNTLICHRLNEQESAEEISNWVGTKNTFNLTAQLNLNDSKNGLASIRKTKEYLIHPDTIKQELQSGDIFYITKVGGFTLDYVKVKYS